MKIRAVVLALPIAAGLLAASEARATNFAILFSGGGQSGGCEAAYDGLDISRGQFDTLPNGTFRMRKRPELLYQEWDALIDDSLSINNPLFQESGNQGVNPLYESPHVRLIPNPLEMSIVPDAARGTWELRLTMEVILQPQEFGTNLEAYALIHTSQFIDAPAVFRMPNMNDLLATRSFFFGEEGMRIRSTRLQQVGATDPDAGASVLGGSWNVTFVPAPGTAALALAPLALAARRRRV